VVRGIFLFVKKCASHYTLMVPSRFECENYHVPLQNAVPLPLSLHKQFGHRTLVNTSVLGIKNPDNWFNVGGGIAYA
jgi:hypothetical protein